MDSSWFEVIPSRPYLYTIRERLDRLDPRFYTTYTNLYLLVGDHSALLFDTGSGLGNLKQIIDEIIADKELIVINSHNHFDHIGSNHQFEETHIHRLDFKKLMQPYPLDFLKGCNSEFEPYFEKREWKMKFADVTIPLIGNEVIDLGGIIVELMYLPGHTPGSIAMASDTGEIFTGDTLHYGAFYLPSKTYMSYFSESLTELGQFLQTNPEYRIFPGHEQFDIDNSIYNKFVQDLSILEEEPDYIDHYLEAEVFETQNFIFIRPSSAYT